MVEHLTFEELLQFNAMTYEELTTGTLAARVTSHVRACGKCRAALTAVQKTEERISSSVKSVKVTGEKQQQKLR